jgi:hypothetical protein
VNTFPRDADALRVMTHLAAVEREVARLREQWDR